MSQPLFMARIADSIAITCTSIEIEKNNGVCFRKTKKKKGAKGVPKKISGSKPLFAKLRF